ncbi:hypothetical protein CBR_g28826 [Chara braunii]|uniref:Uncharacterized protein n=1 Tax=Chara braunii TaxID=69332 RepID=A0A388L9X6_CHABU|nr:hypothetical protein CBR_g28826 [Chara braunii]|eukprot:GBG79111.1 hypothetical protein CBR_g28826 [Chara braunii]
MAEQGEKVISQEPQEQREERGPPGTEVQLSDEDRIQLLIAECYEDGVVPERLRHGEFVIENVIRVFKVNAQIDRLTTAWLKERTITVIFQGAARDLLLKVQEDLVRAYENGWFRRKTFVRGFKRGRVHGEGPNVMSYVAKSREVAQWLIAKGEDTVVIRGIEYRLLFKPWMTRAELDERRRNEEATKIWVSALRVPLRAMFHIPDLVTQAMGAILLQHPLEPNASRPKLMNVKFELAREAEERFEPTISMQLEDGEMYNVEFVCKNTLWCTRCRWWYHTESYDCPRADEGEVEATNERQGGDLNRQRGFNQGEVVYERGIRDATRDLPSNQKGTRESNMVEVSREQNRQGPGRSSQPEGRQNAGGLAEGHASMVGGGGVLGPSGGYATGTCGGFAPIVGMGAVAPWNPTGMVGDPYLHQAHQYQMRQQPMMRGMPPNQWTGEGYMGMQGTNQPYQGYVGGGGGTGYPSRHDMAAGELLRELVEKEVAIDRQALTREGVTPVGSSQHSSTGVKRDETREEVRTFVSREGVETRTGDNQQYEEKFMLPLVCTMLGQEAFILGLIHKNGQTMLPTLAFCGTLGPDMIEARVRQLYADRFCFRLVQTEMMRKITIDTPSGKHIKFYVPLVDARIPTPHGAGLPAVGLTCMPVRVLLDNSTSDLSNVLVEPGVAADFLLGLNDKMSLDKNLESIYIQEVLLEKWQSMSPPRASNEHRPDNIERIHDNNAPGTSNGRT